MRIHSLEAVRKDINGVLAAYLRQQTSRAVAIDPRYGALWQAISDLVMAGGKRLRPYLTVLAYEACGGENYQNILPVAAGQELLHAGLLMHDDIIDRDYVRYGRDNIAGVFRKEYALLVQDAAEASHYAQSTALLAGDAVLSAAHQLVAQSDFASAEKHEAMHFLGTGMFEVIGGELLDTEAALQPLEEVDSLVIARYKTASYSLIAPLSIGACMAGAPAETIHGLQQFGQNTGIAYQLVDDLLGLFGTEAVTGKPAISDLREGKRTYTLQQAMGLAPPKDRSIISHALGNPNVSTRSLTQIRSIVTACGAKSATQKQVDRYRQQALTSLASLHIDQQARAALEEFVHLALARKK